MAEAPYSAVSDLLQQPARIPARLSLRAGLVGDTRAGFGRIYRCPRCQRHIDAIFTQTAGRIVTVVPIVMEARWVCPVGSPWIESSSGEHGPLQSWERRESYCSPRDHTHQRDPNQTRDASTPPLPGRSSNHSSL